jgi:two-component system KDP operon response regulator KdpE
MGATGTAAGPSSSSSSLVTPAKILVVDDEPSVLQVIAGALRSRGYDVRTAATGRAALDEASLDVPDVVLLDLGLPDIDGVRVCHELRRWLRNPIVVLTADGADDRKVAALDEGADDYITKPFSMPELLARVRVALRHRQLISVVADDHVARAGDLWVDTGAHQAGCGSVALSLTAKEFALLALLVRNESRVLTHRALLEHVWGDGARELATLRTHMAQLRRKIRTAGSTVDVVSEAGVGYRLVP